MIGRPRKIGPAEQKRVYDIVAGGCSLNDAADIIGVARSTLNQHMADDATFRKGVDRAIARGKKRLIDKVIKGRPWQAAAWMLERKWGDEFGKKDTIKHEGEVKFGRVTFDGDDDDDRDPNVEASAPLPKAT